MLTPQQVARALGGEVSGNHVLAPGPGHSSEDRSLSIKLDPNAPGGFVVNTFSLSDNPIRCKDYVREKLGLPPWNAKGNGSSQGKSIVATYDYTDETGGLLFQVARFVPKDFRQRRPDGNGGWIWSLGDGRRVLYCLPEISEAIANERTIFIAEGEKAVEALVKLGVPATCSPGGAGKWRDEYSQSLKGADVVVLPDNDEPGKKHAASVTASLANVASRVRVLHLPDLSDKGDPFDWVAKGGTAAKLWGLIEGQREQTKVNGHADPFNLVCLSGVEPVPVDWLWPGYLAIGKLTLLGGDPDSGKSLICTDAAARQSKGIHWPRGPRSRVGSTIFICSEDGIADTIRPRAEAAGADLDQLHVFERRKVRIGRLTTVGQVAGELGRLYRQARRGDVAVADASRLATILAVMRQCLEASELERRIAEMEVALAPATSSVVQLRSRK